MKHIKLTKGKYAIVDDIDYERTAAFRWCLKPNGTTEYAMRAHRVTMHHFLFGRPLFGKVVDHINGNGLDNRRENIRFATRSENRANTYLRRAGRVSSRFVGVSWDKLTHKWRVTFKNKYVGEFASEQQAGRAYMEVSKCS